MEHIREEIDSVTSTPCDNCTLDEKETTADMSSICLAVCLSLFSVTGAFGNSLVIVAVSRFASLRTISNYFIMSLSVADFLITTLVMPLAIYNCLLSGRWYAGEWLCAVWSGLDVFLCTASIFSLGAVSVHRYRTITKPVKYAATRRKPSLAYKYIAIVWLGSTVVSAPFIIALSTEDSTCNLNGSKVYTFLSSMVSFFVPCTVIVFLYLRIYQVAKNRARNSVAPAAASVAFSVRQTNNVSISSVVCALPQNGGQHNFRDKGARQSCLHYCTTETTVTNRDIYFRHGRRNRQPNVRGPQRSRISLLRERKAARTITILVGAFLICWTPFFVIQVFFSLFPSFEVSWIVNKIFESFGWTNSVVNPIIYTIFNKDFRVAFKKILHLERIAIQRKSPGTVIAVLGNVR